jgi:hypothetical protein
MTVAGWIRQRRYWRASDMTPTLSEPTLRAATPRLSSRAVHPPRIKIDPDRALYREQDHIERFFGRRKINRAIATRYDQLAQSFLGMVQTAAVRYWLKLVHIASPFFLTNFGGKRRLIAQTTNISSGRCPSLRISFQL